MSNRTALRLYVPGFFVLASIFGAGCDTAPDASMPSTELAAERSVDDHTIARGYGYDSGFHGTTDDGGDDYGTTATTDLSFEDDLFEDSGLYGRGKNVCPGLKKVSQACCDAAHDVVDNGKDATRCRTLNAKCPTIAWKSHNHVVFEAYRTCI